MGGWCERCGSDLPLQGSPCQWCWDGAGDSDEVRRLAAYFDAAMLRHEQAGDDAEAHRLAARQAAAVLGSIDDERAAPALRDLVDHEHPRLRGAAIRSLGWSGDARDVPAVARGLSASDLHVRFSAVRALPELGGDDAARALATHLGEVDGLQVLEVVQGLAWLRDPRGLEPARQRVQQDLDDHLICGHWFMKPFVRLAGDADRAALRDRVLELIHAAEGAERQSHQYRRTYEAVSAAIAALRPEHPDEAEALQVAAGPLAEPPWRAAPPTLLPLALKHPRTVPKMVIADGEGPTTGPVTKFGGQPEWIGEPAWPVTSEGRPLTFYGQLALDGDSCAYLFFNTGERAESWAPLGEGNALVVQPAEARCHLTTIGLARGPQLYDDVQIDADRRRLRPVRRRAPYERAPVHLVPGLDPPSWETEDPPPGTYFKDDHGSWNKVGGTPLFLQGDETPAGEGWRFAFQFTAGWAGQEMGDGAECYGFVRDDGVGALLWQCH